MKTHGKAVRFLDKILNFAYNKNGVEYEKGNPRL